VHSSTASALAERYVAYGVRAEHYRPVGAAVLWTLERGLDSQRTPQLASVWIAAYTLSDYMIGEAYGEARLAG
jgi:nitric oxide dioxygenase